MAKQLVEPGTAAANSKTRPTRRQMLAGMAIAGATAATPFIGASIAKAATADTLAWDAALPRWKAVEQTYDAICDRHDAVEEAYGDASPRIDRYFDDYGLNTSMERGHVEGALTIYNTRMRLNGAAKVDVAKVADEFDAYAAVLAEDESARDFLLIAILTGMRRSEVAGLEWANIDLDGRTLTVSRTKNGDALILPLSTPLFDILLARRDNNPEATFVFPGVGVTGHLVEMKSFIARVVRTSGVPFFLHDLRRTYATVAESLDISHLSLKYLLNHRCTDITGRYVTRRPCRLAMGRQDRLDGDAGPLGRP